VRWIVKVLIRMYAYLQMPGGTVSKEDGQQSTSFEASSAAACGSVKPASP